MFKEGQTATHKDGRKIVWRDGDWRLMTPTPGSPAVAPGGKPSPETRARIALGLPAAVEAQKNLYAAEGWKPGAANPRGKNPLDTVRGALADVVDGPDNNAGWLAKTIGGQGYQNYQQAAKTYESALLPILSGAAVTDPEAARLIRSDLPQRGDSPATLARKAKNRAMRLNGAATLDGRAPVFPRIDPTGRVLQPKTSAPAEDPLGIR